MIFNLLYYLYSQESIGKLLVDFGYTKNNDETYTITNWKGTLNRRKSTELIIPDNPSIVL